MTILEMVQSMLKTNNLPKDFWGEAVNIVVYLFNRAPTKILEGKMTYEPWIERKHLVDHL